ncbi:MAG: hypothetical protein ACFB6R_02925 [Alphaproteobacteria bacterium]
MNPEFQRNLWLNLSSGRLIMMPAVLGALLFAASLVPMDMGRQAVAGTAKTAFWLIVVFWGTYLSARTIVGEIRERTWDGQRMSSIAPWSMVWGKLFGSTIYIWYGGAICLAVIFFTTSTAQGPGLALRELGYYLLVGVFAHAVAMLSSLLAVRRQLRHPGFGVFLYQFLGLAAAFSVASAWPGNWPEGIDVPLLWYGGEVPARSFVLASIGIFAVWAVVGNHRLMRQELQFTNSPLVWIGFLIFMMAYVAGFTDLIRWGIDSPELRDVLGRMDLGLTLRLVAAVTTAMVLTYVMVFLDGKDIVTLRWIGREASAGRLGNAVSGVPSWGWSLLAVGLVTLALLVTGQPLDIAGQIPADFDLDDDLSILARIAEGPYDWRAWFVASFFFLARDVGIVLLYNASAQSRRADFAAFITLLVLYTVLPAIVLTFTSASAASLFFATPLESPWLAIVPPVVEAGIAWVLVLARMARVRAPVPA